MNERAKIQPVIVEVSLRNAIARRLRDHGVPEFDNIANEVTLELTGKHVVNPPAGVPHTFVIDGVRLSWPQGLDTRVPDAAECEPFNRALNGVSNDRMTTEDNVRVLRACYQALWQRVRIQANERAEQMASAVPEPTAPVVTTAMLEGRNPVLEAHVVCELGHGPGQCSDPECPTRVVVTEKKKRKSTRKKVEPVVSTENTLTTLQDDLANLRKTLESAG